MYNQYNGQFSQLVFFLGDSVLTAQILEKINDNEFFNFSEFNFKLINELNLPEKKDPKATNPLGTEGLLSYDWIERRIYSIPSLVLFALDWSMPLPGVDWKEKETNLLNEYMKFKESLKNKNIKMILLIFLGKNTSYNLALDEKLTNLKKNLDIEHSRYIFLMPGGLELVVQNKKKLQKSIEEISHGYYSEYLKKIKKRITKLQDIASQEKNLKAQIKTAIIGEIMKREKVLKYYNSAYETIKSLMKYYGDSIGFQIKEGDFNSLVGSFEILQRNEELRYLADVINFRIIHIQMSKGQIVESFGLFEKHYKTYKNKVNYSESRLSFEEYRWRSEFHRNFALILLRDFFNIKKNLMDKNLMLRFLNLFHASVLFSDKRNSLMLSKNKDWQSFAGQAASLKKIRPVYFGRTSYRNINDSNPLEKTDNSKKLVESIIYSRVVEEGTRNVAEENIELLRKIEKISLREESDLLFTKYLLSQNYLRSKDFENFTQSASGLIKFLSNAKWHGLLLPLLKSLEEVLRMRSSFVYELLLCQFDLLLHQPEAEQAKASRFEGILKGIEGTEKDLTVKKILTNRDLIKVSLSLPCSGTYFEPANIEIQLEAKGFFQGFFSWLSMELNEKSYSRKVFLEDKEKLAGKLIEDKELIKSNLKVELNLDKMANGDVLTVEYLELVAEKRNEKGKTAVIVFQIPRELVVFTRCDCIAIKPAENPVEVKVKHPNSVFLNEQVDVVISFQKLPNFSDTINNLEFSLYDQDLEYPVSASKSLPRISPACKILTANGTEYNHQSPIAVSNINNNNEVLVKFSMRIEEETEKKFTLHCRYSLEKGSEAKQRDFLKKFSFQITNPFSLRTRVKVLNHYCNNLYKLEHLGGKGSPITLPLNYRSNILYYLTPPMTDCYIKQIRIDPIPSLHIKLLGSLSTSDPLTLRQSEVFTGCFIIIPTELLIEETPIGNLVIQWKRLEHQHDTNRPLNQVTMPLPSVLVESKPFEITLTMGDLAEFGELVPMALGFRNQTGATQRVLISLVDIEGFLVSGDVRKVFEVKNSETRNFEFNLLPLGVGRKKLPGVQLVCQTMDNKMIWDSSGTRFITVIPKKN